MGPDRCLPARQHLVLGQELGTHSAALAGGVLTRSSLVPSDPVKSYSPVICPAAGTAYRWPSSSWRSKHLVRTATSLSGNRLLPASVDKHERLRPKCGDSPRAATEEAPRPGVADSYYDLRMGDELDSGGRPADRLQSSPVPIPAGCFLNGTDVEYLGFKGQRLWRSRVERRLYTWDALHGHVETFNFRGRHVAVLDALTGATIGEAVPGRRIDV